MRVRAYWRFTFFQRQSAGHAKMNVELISIVEQKYDLLPAPLDIADFSARQAPFQVTPVRGEDICSVEFYGIDALAADARREGSDNGFDFGKFGHATFLRMARR